MEYEYLRRLISRGPRRARGGQRCPQPMDLQPLDGYRATG